ncbi:MAG: outer membrane protein assembly factor BamD [Cellvibrio sp.]
MLKRFLSIVLISSLAFLTACSSSDKKEEKFTSEADLYNAAEEQLEHEQWETAIKNLQKLEENFPFGAYAEQGQLELIYAYYSFNKPDEAIATANRFIRLHPQHRNVDYAYYMMGLSSFTKDKGMFERVMPTDLTKRDPGAARESLANFTQLLNRYPDSAYAADAKKRMLYLRNVLARYEIHVANYYFKRQAYVAAVSRGRYVIENYPQTPATPDALAVMVQGYHFLGMQDRANEVLDVLRTNYPNFPALNKAGEFDYEYAEHIGDRNLFGTLTLGLFSKQDTIGFDTRALYDAEYQKAPRVKN